MIYWLLPASVSLSLFPFKFSHPSDLLFHPLVQIMLHSPSFKATTMTQIFLPLAWPSSIFFTHGGPKTLKMITEVIVTDECVTATHLQRACWAALSFASVSWRSHRHYSQIKGLLCVGKWHSAPWQKLAFYREKPLPKAWVVLAVWVWLKTRTVGDAGWGALPAVKDYCTYILWCTFCANCYLVGAVHLVTECGCVCVLPSAFLQGTGLFWCCSYGRRLSLTRNTSSRIRNTAGAVLGVHLSVSLGLKLPNWLHPHSLPWRWHNIWVCRGIFQWLKLYK